MDPTLNLSLSIKPISFQMDLTTAKLVEPNRWLLVRIFSEGYRW